jgi:peroxiredoxin
MPDIGRWQAEHADRLTIAVISRGGAQANKAKSAEHGLRNVLLQTQYEVADAFLAHGTPAAVVVAADGTIASPVALGSDAIRGLLAQTIGGAVPAPARPYLAPVPNPNSGPAAPPAAARIGQPAPALSLPDLDGKIVSLADFRGSETLVVFWNPGCGFCTQMLPDLKRWESNSPPGAPKVLVVSTGTLEANREMGLRAPVLLDQSFTVGGRFGANGTPMAVLLDAGGKVASPVVAGAEAVLALARGQRQG